MAPVSIVQQVLTGSFRGFLASGLLPAAMLLAGGALIHVGVDETLRWLAATADAKALTTDVLAVLAAWLSLAFLIYLSRGLFVELVSDIPARRLPHWARALLLRNIIRLRRRVYARYDAALAARSALHWAVRLDFATDTHAQGAAPDGLEVPATVPAARASLDALLARVAPHLPAGRLLWHYARTAAALDALLGHCRACGVSAPARAEIDAWRALRARHPAAFEVLLEEAIRRHTAALGEKSKFPSGAYLAPTRFGNAQERIDDYCYDRYRIPSYTLWTRLMPLLDRATLDQVTQHKRTVEALVTASITFAAIVVVGLFGLAQADAVVRVEYALLAVAMPAAAGYLMYGLSVIHVMQMGDAMAGIIDAHRRKLLKEFGLHPTTFGEEQQQFVALNALFTNADAGPLEALPAPRHALDIPSPTSS